MESVTPWTIADAIGILAMIAMPFVAAPIVYSTIAAGPLVVGELT